MLCGLFSAASSFLRGVIGCLCCLLVGGPILVIVGITMIVAPNNRAEQVAAYNTAITNFNTGVFSSWAGSIDSVTASQESLSIVVSGNTDGVNPGTSSVMYASVYVSSSEYVSFVFNKLTTFSRTVSTTQSSTDYISCTSSYSNTNDYCSSTTMAQKCRSLYGSSATYVGSGCNENSGSCGYCQYTNYLQSYCVVVSPISSGSSGTWQEDPSKRTCRYPFSSGSQVYASSGSSTTYIPFYVYSSTDPYLVLQQQTEGTNDFGLTRSQQTKIGFALVAVGAVMTAGVAAGFFIVYRMITNNRAANTQQTFAVPLQQQQQQPVGYAQPGYAQPGYGYAQQQPQPGYGQQLPPPGYAQPGGYAQQPQPGYTPMPYNQPPTYAYEQQPQGVAYGQPPPPPPPPGYGPINCEVQPVGQPGIY